MPFVILDRDGVINEDTGNFVRTPEEWLPIPGSLQAIALLTAHGYRIVVITNQSGIARGFYDLPMLERIHAKMRAAVEQAGGIIEDVFFCPHGPEDFCECRKPKPGLYRAFAEKYGIDLNSIPTVGDSLRDIQAARAVGADPILVETGHGARTITRNPDLDVPYCSNLYEAAQHILRRNP